MPKSAITVIELAGDPIADTADFFVDSLGFRVTRVFPADNPREIEVSGWGLTVLLRSAPALAGPVTGTSLRLPAEARAKGMATEVTAPNGISIYFDTPSPTPTTVALPQGVEVFVSDADAQWHVGRAGLEYRDLLPERLGGAVIASQIRLPHGGDVPDYVHYHQVALQFIYCRRGTIRVVYQDQGEPFEMRAGDCVLQPPGLRHQVLASSPGAEVVELACPAEHQTFGDLQLTLPNGVGRAGQRYEGQAFVWHRGEQAVPQASPAAPGWAWRDTGIGEATDKLADTGVWSAQAGAQPLVLEPALMHFLFVLEGQVALQGPAMTHQSLAGMSTPVSEGAGLAIAPGDALHLLPAGDGPVQVLYTALRREPVCPVL